MSSSYSVWNSRSRAAGRSGLTTEPVRRPLLLPEPILESRVLDGAMARSKGPSTDAASEP